MLNAVKHRVRAKLKAHLVRQMPRGVNLALDIEQMYPGYEPPLILDVGANVGQTALAFVRDWPGARIECFEPITSTYATLRSAVSGLPHVRCHQLALGATVTEATMFVAEHADSDGSADDLSVLSSMTTAAGRPTDRNERVRVSTVSEFCNTEGIASVGLLKVDTEGYDLEVLKGAHAMLREQRIDWVQVEAGMNPSNQLHVPFARFVEYMTDRSYWLFGLYDQFHEWTLEKPYLRRVNAVFVSQKMIDAYDHAAQ